MNTTVSRFSSHLILLPSVVCFSIVNSADSTFLVDNLRLAYTDGDNIKNLFLQSREKGVNTTIGTPPYSTTCHARNGFEF